MRTRSSFGGRHELGQNFLIHTPTLRTITDLVAATGGEILEIGAGDGALTSHLARLQRDLTAIDIDERRVAALRRSMPGVRVEHIDVLRHPLDQPVIVGNIPYHLTTPILRRLLARGRWQHAILLTQWEVARKRAGVGGRTMMTAQAAPWFEFALHGRVPARGFRPVPSVDGGLLSVRRRPSPLIPLAQRSAYERFVRDVFTATGRGLPLMLSGATGLQRRAAKAAVARAGIPDDRLPRDLDERQWSALWIALGTARGTALGTAL